MIYGLFANNKPNRLGYITNEYYWVFKNLLDGYPGKVGKEFSFFPKFLPLWQENLQNQDLFPKIFRNVSVWKEEFGEDLVSLLRRRKITLLSPPKRS